MTFNFEPDIQFLLHGVKFNIVSISHGMFHCSIPAHAHSKGSYELHYITGGTGALVVGDVSYPLSTGSFYVTGPLIFHAQIPNINNPMSEYNIYLTADILSSNQQNELIQTFLSTKFWIGQPDDRLINCLTNIAVELSSKTSGYMDLIRVLFQEFILYAAKSYLKETDSIPSISINERTESICSLPENRHFLTIEQCFLNQYNTISLTSLAEKLCLSIRQTERLLNQYYGRTFSQKKSEARMAVAASLLHDQSLSLSDIAEQLGYSSKEHFSSAFQRYYHVSPRKFCSSQHIQADSKASQSDII